MTVNNLNEKEMKKLYGLITLAVILFASCDKSNEITENESLIFSFHRGGGWGGLDENLIITADTMHYSIRFHDIQTSEETNYQTTIKTSDKQWDFLLKTFDWAAFTKISNGHCQACIDGVDVTFSASQNGKTYSFFNGGGDEHFQQMEDFFNAIWIQANIFNMYSLPSFGCGSFFVYKTNNNNYYNDIGIAVSGNREKLNLSKTEQTFDLNKIDVQDLKVDVQRFTPGSRGYYCDCVLEGDLLDTWTSISGTVRIKIVEDYEGDPSAFEKNYTINVILENAVLQNDKGSIITVKQLEFKNVNVGWVPG
jgi:hypothetical protein